MKQSPENNLRAWREFRKLTQEDLAEKVGTTAAVISLLENGQRGLSASWLQRFAPHLEVPAGYLLDHRPGDLTADMLRAWAAVPQEQKSHALAALQSYAQEKTGT